MKVISNIRRAWRYVVLAYKYNKAVNAAEKKHRLTGTTQFVVKGAGESLLVLTRKQYRNLVSKHKARYVTSMQMYQGCFYCTRWYDGQEPLPEDIKQRKRRVFFAAFGF